MADGRKEFRNTNYLIPVKLEKKALNYMFSP